MRDISSRSDSHEQQKRIHLFPTHQISDTVIKTFGRTCLRPYQLRNDWLEKVTFATEKNVNFWHTLTWNSSVPTFSHITPYVSMVDKDQGFLVLTLKALVLKKKKKGKMNLFYTNYWRLFLVLHATKYSATFWSALIQRLCSFFLPLVNIKRLSQLPFSPSLSPSCQSLTLSSS